MHEILFIKPIIFIFRLWGEGQILISNSRILCINIDSSATEILKNLILAGIGYVGLVDDQHITEQDIKENFFVNKSDLKKLRGQVCLDNLLELNPDTQGIFYNLSPQEFTKNCLLQLATYDLVILCNLNEVSFEINFLILFLYLVDCFPNSSRG